MLIRSTPQSGALLLALRSSRTVGASGARKRCSAPCSLSILTKKTKPLLVGVVDWSEPQASVQSPDRISLFANNHLE
jgi:hypothetical protein